MTVSLTDESRVRRASPKAAIADLKTGVVVAMSKVEAGGTTAYLVMVPRD